MKSARLRLIFCAILCATVFAMTMLPAPKAARPTSQLPKLTDDPRVLSALKSLDGQRGHNRRTDTHHGNTGADL